jgi:translocation and assembly module TamB
VDHLTLASRFGSLNTSGRLDPHGPIDLQVDGKFPLAVLASLRPEVRVADGTLEITGRVGGSAAAPRLTGEATVHHGTLQTRDRPETLRDVEARIVLSPGGLRLVEATGSLGRGQIRASGDMTLQEWQLGAYRFNLVGRNVSIAPVEGLQTAWDLDLELVGQGARAQLRGEGRLLQGTVTGRFSLLSILLSKTPGRVAETSAAIPLRILLKLGDNLRVNMDVARLRGGGTLSLEGTTAEPVLLGALESQEGRITFRNKRWTLVSGAIRFVDPRRIQPILDVTARTQINEYDVTLRLSGRPDELLVSLSSSPALPQDDLLLLVTLGTTKGEAGKSPGGAAAGEIVRLLAEDLLGTTVGGGLGPDQFSLATGDNKQQIIQMGKQLTEEVRVLYSQSFSGTTKRVVRIEYQVIGPLLLSAEQDFQAGFGGDLLLRFRFR